MADLEESSAQQGGEGERQERVSHGDKLNRTITGCLLGREPASLSEPKKSSLLDELEDSIWDLGEG